MKISNLTFDNKSGYGPSPNKVFRARVLEASEGETILDIPGRGSLEVESQIDLSEFRNQEIQFIIKNIIGGKLEITPLLSDKLSENTVDSEDNNLVIKIIRDLKLENLAGIEEIVEEFIKQDLSLDRKNLEEVSRIFSRLLEIRDLENNNFKYLELIRPKESIVQSVEGTDFVGKSILDGVFKSEDFKEARVVLEGILAEFADSLKADVDLDFIENKILDLIDFTGPDKEGRREEIVFSNIKNLLSTDLESLENSVNFNILSKEIETIDLASDKNIFELVTFMKKHDIKPSLNNIKKLNLILEKPFEFFKDLKTNIEDANKLIFTLLGKDLRESLYELEIKGSLDRLEFSSILEEVIENRKDDLAKNIWEIKSSREFLRDVNKNIVFNFVPLEFQDQGVRGIVEFFKKKTSEKQGNKSLNILLKLATKNLGEISVYFQSLEEDLSLTIGVGKEERESFKKGEEILILRLRRLGFNIGSINFIEKKDFKFINLIKTKKKTINLLDIEV